MKCLQLIVKFSKVFSKLTSLNIAKHAVCHCGYNAERTIVAKCVAGKDYIIIILAQAVDKHSKLFRSNQID